MDTNDSFRAKVATLFIELVGDRAEQLRADRFSNTICDVITDALIDENCSEKQLLHKDQIAINLTDWVGDAAFLVALHLYPERFTREEIQAGIDQLLIHVPDHLNEAARLANSDVCAAEIQKHLDPLVGMRLETTYRAAGMRCFCFGKFTNDIKATEERALHVQCPWRIKNPSADIVTGRADLWESVDEKVDVTTWTYETSENVQDQKINLLLDILYEKHRLKPDDPTPLEVESVEAQACGDAVIHFSEGYKLELFISGTRGESWRIFRPKSGERHFVVE